MAVERERIQPVRLEDELKHSYLDYAMSVIIGRALPDVRDGLKPVHRRILYAMKTLGNEWNKPYKKSARIVGDVIGKYHPHGDTAVYDALVRMAQPFSMRYPLVDGQGNFGSIDGDPPAAMRYTEVRMCPITQELLKDLEKETVEWLPNYDGTLKEPVVLPSRLPNLLINGSAGIAVGMATNIPPHNLGEIIDALIACLERPEITVEELMQFVPGPDFPTGGIIYGEEGIKKAYTEGKGIISIRGRVEIEEKKGKTCLVISEIPFQLCKTRLIEKIAELIKEKRITGIVEIRDESDREGIRIVLEIKRGENVQVILNKLYTYTPLETSYGIILLTLVHNRPVLCHLKTLLVSFLEHRREIIIRRTQYELKKAKEKAHILEGLKIALDHLDTVISLIRKAESPSVAKKELIHQFELTEIQARAILEMRLQRLTQLERASLIQEYKASLQDIARYEAILKSGALVKEIIKEELKEIKNKYADPRRTEIKAQREKIYTEDLIPDEEVVVTLTHRGYVKRIPLDVYREQRRGGKGIMGVDLKKKDFVQDIFIASTHSYLLIFTQKGIAYGLKVYEIPPGGRIAMGKPLVNLINLPPQEKIAFVLSVKDFKNDLFITMVTKKGIVKKTPISEFTYLTSTIRGIKAATIDPDDQLVCGHLTEGKNDIFLLTKTGISIRFKESDVRPMGRMARGVIGIRLDDNNWVVSMDTLIENKGFILIVTEKGYGKRTSVELFRVQSRGGKGIIALKTSKKTGNVIGMTYVGDSDEILLINNIGKIIRLKVDNISILGRQARGVKLINLKEDERVVGVAKVLKENMI
ncbi:DNA gyrase subunit A [Candidatus Desulfofervidus auxilii]|uniref:DNA gyrase subunit A n=2 Tax=Desulfofervidus auxilii TaxID=1621989 RepID=A0A7U4QLH9_DESA2|nr:DNA gyrase subunit A [Candidatus Desulfofervidus auxilii]AMM41543.1 DNA gyrase subunit A [Candidatus Desulfofervidus auxilii]